MKNNRFTQTVLTVALLSIATLTQAAPVPTGKKLKDLKEWCSYTADTKTCVNEMIRCYKNPKDEKHCKATIKTFEEEYDYRK